MKLLQTHILFTLILSTSGCVSSQKLNKNKDIKLDSLKILLKNNASKKTVLEKLGAPKEKELDRWVYYKRAAPKVLLFFKKNKLTHISYSIWEGERLEKPNIF